VRWIALLLLAAASSAQEASTQTHWVQRSLPGTQFARTLLGDEPLCKMPDKHTARRFGALRFGERSVPVAIGRNQIWIDLDTDGDLSDEAPLSAVPHQDGWRVNAELALPLRLTLRWEGDVPPAIDHLIRAHRAGEVVLEERLRPFALRDADHDLVPDGLLIDIDGDGKLGGSHEEYALGEAFRLRDAGYVAHFAGAGDNVSFGTVKPPPARRPREWKTEPVPPAGVDRKTRPFSELWTEFENGRIDALRAMGTRQHAMHADRIVGVAREHADPRARIVALDVLRAMDAPGRRPLCEERLARERNKRVRDAILRHLAYEGAQDVLVRCEDERAYYFASRYFPRGAPEEFMLAAAKDARPAVRAMALQDLFRLGHPAARDLALKAAKVKNLPTAVGRAIVLVLGAAADAESVAALMALAGEGNSVYIAEVRRMLALARGKGVVGGVAVFLRHRDPRQCRLATEILHGNRGPGATRALVARLAREHDPDLVRLLVEALAGRDDPDVVQALAKVAGGKGELHARNAAVRALAALPSGRTAFLALLSSNAVETRVLALDALPPTTDPAFAAAAARGLVNRAWQVRLASAQTLRRIRVKSVIEPLVVCLEKEKNLRVKRAVGDTLYRLTGENMRDFADLWRKWWDAHRNGFRMAEREPEPRVRKPGETKTVASFFGVPVVEKNVIFVVDRSGSMSARAGRDNPTRFEIAVKEILGAVGKLEDGSKVNVIFFSSGTSSWKPALTRVSKGTRNALRKTLEGTTPSGATELYDGLELALQDPNVQTIYLLSDGKPSGGQYIRTEDILGGVRRLNQVRRAVIHCIAVGFDSDLLRRLAKEHGGEYAQR